MGGLWSVLSSVTGLTSHCGTHATPHTSHRYHHTRSLKFVHSPCWDETGWNSRDSGFDTDVLRFLWWGLTEYVKDYFCLNLSFTGEIVLEQYCNENRWIKSQLIENKMIQNIWVKENKKIVITSLGVKVKLFDTSSSVTVKSSEKERGPKSHFGHKLWTILFVIIYKHYFEFNVCITVFNLTNFKLN